MMIFLGIQRTPESSHQFRQVTSGHFGARQLFESTYHRIIPHGPTLYNNMTAQFGYIFQLQYLIQTVLHDRISQSGCNIVNRCSFTQHLFHLRIHKDGTARAQVAGLSRTAGRLCKIAGRITQCIGKGLYKRTAARRAGFIDFNPVDDAFLYEDGFHVLSADVEDKRNIFIKIMSRHVVSHSLYDASIQLKCGLDQVFAITGRAASLDVQDGLRLTALFLELVQTFRYGFNRMSSVGLIESEKDAVIRIDGYNLGCS